MIRARAYRMSAQVGPGHRIEIVAPEIAEGESLEVILLPAQIPQTVSSAFERIDALRLLDRDAAYWAERERELQESRDSWDR